MQPAVIIAAFVVGAAVGGSAAWTHQQSKIADIEAAGKAASIRAKEQTNAAIEEKEKSDEKYRASIDALSADLERLRIARARSNYVPASPSGSRNPGIACFDRAALERAIQRLDDGISGVVAKGDSSAVALDSLRVWYAEILKTK